MSYIDRRIPDRIESGEYQYLNCKVGGTQKPGPKTEARVLERLETALSNSFLQIYYKYPDTGRRDDNNHLDIVALHPQTGILIIQIIGLEIDEIKQINGPDWYIVDKSRPIHPNSIASDGKIAVRHQLENLGGQLVDDDGRSVVPCQHFVALPNIKKKDWRDKFPTEDFDELLFWDDIEDRTQFFQKLAVPDNPRLTESILKECLGALKFSDAISGNQLNPAATPNSKRELLEHINQRLKILTDQQLRIGLQAPDGPQRVRGIAGSGKTVVHAFRAAKLHWEHEDWNIAVTFRNRGLRQTHENLISAFYRQFSGEDSFDKDKLNVFHAWGGSTPGMYSEISSKAGPRTLRYSDATNLFGYENPFAHCCGEVLKKGDIPEMYDAILIDEGQDLPNAFFKMCYQACTPEKRLYWSYDEAQSLGTLEARSARELFGSDSKGNPEVDLSENYSGGVNASHVMRTSFRTPRSVLMTAHGFGMGLYREGPVVQTITNQQGWEDIGYEIKDGNFTRSGNQITLTRPLSNSPHPLWDYQSPSELMRLRVEDSRREEINWVIEDIATLVKDENVLPEEILITFLWDFNVRKRLLKQLIEGLEAEFSNSKTIVNDVSHITRKLGTRGQIKKPGQISLSNIYHARGNESPFVYVMGLDMVAEQTSKKLTKGREKTWREEHIDIRNKAFVGFTRTQGWLTITGSNPGNRVVGELNRVLSDTKSDEPRLTLEVPPKNSPFKNLDPTDPKLVITDE